MLERMYVLRLNHWKNFACLVDSIQDVKFTYPLILKQGYGFSSGHVWMWDMDYKESWVQRIWCFWTVVLEKTFESPLDCKEVQ